MDFLWPLLGGAAGAAIINGVVGYIRLRADRKDAHSKWQREQEQEHAVWLRNQKLEAYSEFLDAYTELYKQIELARADGGTARDLDEYVTKASPTKITLIAPRDIADLASTIHGHLMWLALWVESIDKEAVNLQKTKQAYGTKSLEFEKAVIEDMNTTATGQKQPR